MERGAGARSTGVGRGRGWARGWDRAGVGRLGRRWALPPPPLAPGLRKRPGEPLGCVCRPRREVFKAKHRQTGQKVALKKVLMENEKEGVSRRRGVPCPSQPRGTGRALARGRRA